MRITARLLGARAGRASPSLTRTLTRAGALTLKALELPDDGSTLPRADELPAVFVGAASAKDEDWPRRHPGKAAVVVLAPVQA